MNISNLSLLEDCLKIISIKNVAEKLNVCIGTVKRWIELKDVPIHYTFDLHKILSKEIKNESDWNTCPTAIV